MLKIDRPHRSVPSISNSADALDAFVGEDVEDVILARPRTRRSRPPNLAVAESFGFEVEERRLGWQLEDRETNVGDFQSVSLETRNVP